MVRGEIRLMRDLIARLKEQTADLERQVVQLRENNIRLQERLDASHQVDSMDHMGVCLHSCVPWAGMPLELVCDL